MPGRFTGMYSTHFIGIVILLVIWIVLFKFTHLLIRLLLREPLIGWAIGPLGITIVFLHEPAILYIWLDVLGPALVSGVVLYIGLFTSLAPVVIPHHPLLEILVVVCGVLLSSTGDLVNALSDLIHPLWGEARVLRSIQWLRSTWAQIHFTSFGCSYLNDHFGSSPTELLQAL
jgi:hypothetical protein